MIVNTQVRFSGDIGTVLKEYQRGGKWFESITREIASNGLALLKTRIHEEGKAGDGSDIGKYSTKPIYVNPDNSPKKFEPMGKGDVTGERKSKKITARFSSIKTRKESSKKIKVVGERIRKDRYFAGGYDEFKTYIGRNELGKVNLFLSGGLENGFVIIGTPQGFGLGWLNDEMYLRARALEQKYGKPIWFLNDNEIREIIEAAKNSNNAFS